MWLFILVLHVSLAVCRCSLFEPCRLLANRTYLCVLPHMHAHAHVHAHVLQPITAAQITLNAIARFLHFSERPEAFCSVRKKARIMSYVPSPQRPDIEAPTQTSVDHSAAGAA